MKIRGAALVLIVASSLIVATPANADPLCDTYLLIGARGTSEPPQGSDTYEADPYAGTGILANRIYNTLQPIVVANGREERIGDN